MASSGSYGFSPTIAEILDESFERCGHDPQELTVRHIRSARMSMNLLLKSWPGPKLWAMDEQSVSTTVGMSTFTPPAGTIDIFSMILRRDDVDTPMEPISKMDYHVIPDKTVQGRPDRYMIDRQITPVVYIWQLGENTTDTIRYWRMRQVQTVTGSRETLDLPDRWHDAFCADLAWRLSFKWAPDRREALEKERSSAFFAARVEERDRAPVTMNPRYR